MFGKLKAMMKRKAIASYNREDAYTSCVQRIMAIHRMAILSSGEEREVGFEDAIISSSAIEGFCERVESCPDCFSKAAMAIDYIANFHPFVEGNKRTAFQLAIAILRAGGYELNDDYETFLFIKDVAWGKISGDEIETWLRLNTHVSNL